MEDIPGQKDLEEWRIEVANFRCDIVKSLAEHLASAGGHGEKQRGLMELAERQYKLPSGQVTTISLATLRRWLEAFMAAGLEALKPGLRSDYGASRAIPEEWVQKAIALRTEVPARTATMLVEVLKRVEGYPKEGINPHTLDKVLHRRGLTRRQARMLKRKTKRALRWVAKHVNDLWQGDATPGVWLPNPRNPKRKLLTKLILWIDDVSRLVVYAEFFWDEKLPRMERTLKLGLLKRGKPIRLYIDNGSVFRASQFKATLHELKIKRIHSRPRQPRGRGKVERMLQTVQEGFYPEAYAAKISTLEELNEALWSWLARVYHERIHSETRQKPIDLYRSGLAHVHSVDTVKVARAFLWRYQRKVSAAGFISLNGNSYSVDPVWAGRRIELRCDPFDLAHIEVYRDARPIGTATVRKLKNGAVIDLVPIAPPAPTPPPTGINFIELVKDEHRRQLAAEVGEIPFRDALSKSQEDKP